MADIGRPTDYNEDILNKAKEYFEVYHEHGDLVPTVVGLALYLGVSRKSIYRWKEEHEDFRHTLDRLIMKQEQMLVGGGLGGDYNSAIAKLMLGNHGYHEKQDIDHSGETDLNIKVEYVG